jgi:SAM-dependent methyltransferase
MSVVLKAKRALLKSVPGMIPLQVFLYKFKPYKAKFRTFYLQNGWRNGESRSGPGSNMASTRAIREALPDMFRRLEIKTILDIPCGDFYWMDKVDLTGVQYLGADLVEEMIEDNRAKNLKRNVRFQTLDLLKGPIPTHDLVFCRDCLFHFSNKLILKALKNIKESGSRYLLTNTFDVQQNTEITTVGACRLINLELSPYNLPKPILFVLEHGNQKMALWNLKDIQL